MSFISKKEISTVSIIMRSKDEQPYAEKALKKLFEQNYKDFILYNIDSGSTDGTLEVIREFNVNPEYIVQIKPEEYNPGKVLNLMVGKTKSPIIVFLNSDAIPINNCWLSELLKPILEGQADATFSRQIPRKDARFIVKYDYDRAYNKTNIKKNPDFFSAVSCAFRRELWERTPFYTEGYSEDMIWSKANQEQGARFIYASNSIVEHSHNYTFNQLYKRMYDEDIANVYAYEITPNFFWQMFLFAKDVCRDFIYAVSKGNIFSIPYNVCYRAVMHLGFYQGKREGWKRYQKK